MPKHSSVKRYQEYLQTSLIPHLLREGKEGTASDFQEAIFWLEDQQFQLNNMAQAEKGRIEMVKVFSEGLKSLFTDVPKALPLSTAERT